MASNQYAPKSGKMSKVWWTFREIGHRMQFFMQNSIFLPLAFLQKLAIELLDVFDRKRNCCICVYLFFSCWSFFSLVTQLQKKVWLLCTSQTYGWKYPKFVLSSTYVQKTKIVRNLSFQPKKYMPQETKYQNTFSAITMSASKYSGKQFSTITQ